MTVLYDFFHWLYSLLKQCVAKLATVGGAVVSAITAGVAFISSLFGRWNFTNTVVGWIDSATAALENVIPNSSSELGEVLFGFLALDQLATIAVALFALTVGVVVLVFVTMFVALFAIVPAILTIRALLKAIKTISGGFVDP